MENIEFFRIYLEKEGQAVFFPDEILDGKLQLKVSKPLKVNGVKILVNGISKVCW